MSRQTKQYHVAVLIMFLVFGSSKLQATAVKSIYTWTYNNKLFTMVYYYDQPTYNYYKGQDRVYNNFLFYLNENPKYPVIAEFAAEFKKIAAEHKLSDWQLAECVISFIQTMKYKNDGTYEYPRYPIETLVEKGGDCEDTAILLEAILKELGFDCVLVSPTKHMGVGIALKYEISGTAFQHRNKFYYYIETTSAGWGIGDYPEHLSASVTILDPGDVDGGVLLSEYNYTYKNYDNETATIETPEVAETNTEEKETAIEPEAQEADYGLEPDFNFEATPENSYTIDIDQVVIDGEKETVVTKKVEANGKEKIVATSN
ncbi:MAG: hypothetical protein IPO24_18660 [Bacteroidetes bacterium]|nr:hypothetical protein [Bacteroidota bacterium]